MVFVLHTPDQIERDVKLTEHGGGGEDDHDEGDQRSAQPTLWSGYALNDGCGDLGRPLARHAPDLIHGHLSDGFVLEDSPGADNAHDHDRRHRDEGIKGHGGAAGGGFVPPPRKCRSPEQPQDRGGFHEDRRPMRPHLGPLRCGPFQPQRGISNA
jgi:hypothetical protein